MASLTFLITLQRAVSFLLAAWLIPIYQILLCHEEVCYQVHPLARPRLHFPPTYWRCCALRARGAVCLGGGWLHQCAGETCCQSSYSVWLVQGKHEMLVNAPNVCSFLPSMRAFPNAQKALQRRATHTQTGQRKGSSRVVFSRLFWTS